IEAIEERSDGKFVVAGSGRAPSLFGAFEFGRYLPSGELDPSFGEGGLATVPVNEIGGALAMDQTPSGKLVAAGLQATKTFEQHIAVVRVTENGEPDPSFSTVPSAGVRVIDIPESDRETAYAVKVLGNGNVIAGGETSEGAFLIELDAEGNLVSGFGKGG